MSDTELLAAERQKVIDASKLVASLQNDRAAKDREIERLREVVQLVITDPSNSLSRQSAAAIQSVRGEPIDASKYVLIERSQLAAAEATIAELRNRLRKTCQTLVEAVGADGPCDAEEAASRAVSQVERLTRERDEAKLDHGDFLAFMAAELDGFPCCHGPAGNGAHAATPPMMWPELVSCIAANAKRELQDKLTAAEQSRDKAEQSLAEVRRVLCEWDASDILRKFGDGCTNAGKHSIPGMPTNPADCEECLAAVVNALRRAALSQLEAKGGA